MLQARTARLALASFLSLFLELLLIRWLGTEVRIFTHLRNLVLIACFAGLGAGYGLREVRVPLLVTFWGMLVLTLASLPPLIAGTFSLKNLAVGLTFSGLYSWQPQQPWPIFLLALTALLVTFTLLAAMFVPLGQLLGELFRTSPNQLRDYTVNVLASLAGVLAFTLLSFVGAPPMLWMLLAFGPLLLLLPPRPTQWLGGVAALAGVLAVLYATPLPAGVFDVVWSPYQKIQMWRVEATQTDDGFHLSPAGRYPNGPVLQMLDVNDIAMMWLLDMSDRQLQTYPWLSRPDKIEWYDFPYHVYPHPARVLIIGAGGGNDTAAALRHGAQRVDAVEIDPRIAEMGRRFHPEHPYDDPRVHLHLTDARRFLSVDHGTYDLIVYAQLDNTDYNNLSNLTNIRMDSYIYTRECFERAHQLLAPDGLMAVNFGANDYWGRRMVRLLQEATGTVARSFRNELQFHFPGQENTYLIDPANRLAQQLPLDSKLAAWVKGHEANWQPETDAPSVTDDWPYWYLPRRAIPTLELCVMTTLAALSFFLLWLFGSGAGSSQGPHFFFLGAAFMLLETHLITRVALLLGATWICNAAVISAVLLMIVAANVVVEKWKPSPRLVYPLLFVSLLPQLAALNRWIDPGNTLAVCMLLLLFALPVFFAGLVFGGSFDVEAAPDAALRANLLGAICGGLLEETSYVFGMGALIWIVIGLYALSMLVKKKQDGPEAIPISSARLES